MAYNNPYLNTYNNQYNIPQMQNQLAQLQAMQNQIQSPIPNQQQPNGVTQMGTFVVVRTVQDMENYPAPINGEPVNIFIDGKGVFYSKKMINGSTNCQPFSFAPLNNTPIEQEVNKSENENTILKMLGELAQRIEKIENQSTDKSEVKINGIKSN